MQVEIRHQPGFAVSRCHLQPGESMRSESGAMMAMSYGVEVSADTGGGFGKALKRSVLGAESFFVTTYTAGPQYAGWVDVAANLPGDALAVEVHPSRALIATRGSWLANASGVTLESKWGGSQMFFGGEGGFVVRFTGQGAVALGAYGAIDQYDLPAGQGFTLDSGHLVAYQEGVQVQVRKAAKGWMNTVKSGEGLVMDFVGPGTVWTQTRNSDALVGWLTRVLPFSRS
ncbi:MAG: TIGR00266 family protein [Candidatus Nanopelagicales bacterium]